MPNTRGSGWGNPVDQGVERTWIIGQNALSMNLSVALLPAAGGLLTVLFGWRGPFAMHASTIVLAVFAAALLPPDQRRATEPLRHQLRKARPHLLQPEVGVLLLVAADQMVVVPLQSRAASLAPEEHRAVTVAAWGTAIRIGQVSGPATVAGLLAIGNTRLVVTTGAALSAAMLVFVTLVRNFIDRDPRFRKAI